jgi:rod shape-determining protein MreC
VRHANHLFASALVRASTNTGELAIKPLFTKGSATSSRALVAILAMIGLIFISLYTDWLKPVRQQLNELAVPFYELTDVPRKMGDWRRDTFVSRSQLQSENETLRTELLIHQRKLQQMAALAAENVRLRQLMNATDMLQDKVLVAELIGVSPNPLTHTVMINRGRLQGVYEGQPLLDAFGLMGQVVEVNDSTSQVLLISDPTHALPVQVNRNGVRSVAEGTGDLNRLRLRHVSNTTDIRVGDLLVSSGLGGRFPVGYPVAEVDTIVRDPGQSFATVILRPMARLDRSRHVLLVFDSREIKP